MSKSLKNSFIGLTLSAVTFSSAFADNWTGGYAGISGGWGVSNIDSKVSPVGTVSVSDFNTRPMDIRANGSMFGIQGGYNWQRQNMVYGVEANIDGSGISGTKQAESISMLSSNAIDGYTITDKIDWLASIRGRLGFLTGPGMAYATGGAAWEGLNTRSLVNAEVAPSTYGVTATTNHTSDRFGYVLGGGYELMMDQHLSVRGEYLFYNFNHNNHDAMSFSSCATAGQCNASVATASNNVSVLRVGIDYKFD